MKEKNLKLWHAVSAWGILIVLLLFLIDSFTDFTSIDGLKNKMKEKKADKEAFIGKPEIKIKDGVFTPEAMLAMGRLSDPQVSPDGTKILYGVSYTSIEQNRSCNNLYICNIDGSSVQRLTAEGKSFSNARWSADGESIAFIQGGQIWTAKLKGREGAYRLGKKVQISDVPAGISQFTLSPDQTKVMYVSTVQSALKKPSDLYEDLDKSDAISADDLMYRHWDHWVKEVPHTFVAGFAFGKEGKNSIVPETSKDILAAETEIYELPTEPFSGIEQLSWSPDGKTIAYSCRKLTGKKYAFSTNTEIYFYDVESGECTQLTMGGGYDTNPVWSPDGKRLCWISMERDGYEADKQRLMTADIDWAVPVKGSGSNASRLPLVSNIKDITSSFKYNASAPVWSPDSDGIYFSALAEGLQGIFKAEYASDWKIVRITEDDLWFDFNSPFHISESDGTVTLLADYSSMNFPTELVSIRIGDDKAEQARDGNVKMTPLEPAHSTPLEAECEIIPEPVHISRISHVNDDILSQLDPVKTEARHIRTADGKDMLTWVVYPPHFDRTKVYPSILICLGGPQGTLSQGWSYRWNYRLMASQGYITVLPNRRGTTAFGQEWTEQISGDYPGLNMQDYLAAAKTLKAEPYVGKMAACGASYGGYSVYYLCGTHGDTFDAFIAHAGIFNEEHMYMTTEEMWFPNWDNGGLHTCETDPRVGTDDCPVGPAGDGETFGGIRQGGSPWSSAPKAERHYRLSPHNLVTNWHTPILVTHGGMDFRVPVDEGMAAYNAAQLMGVPSRLIVFPDENHWILKPQNALYWHREYFRWLDRWLK
ncbi:MAG: S9 family peptidase [Bacteroidetes bacterium]|uniref:S9 family peptidase n=1 Tax=Candidatus Cryptobacteroides avicola TaxID=2840757 RepID=A0A940DTL1_9BACT|nr:S9 family peptidase [Candidatus Cryptobacteroides avicola]